MPFRLKVSVVILATLLALLLIGPLIIPIAPLRDTVPEQDLADPDSRFAQVAGLTLHYKTAGQEQDRPAFVLLHGFGSSTFTWDALMPRLGELGYAVAFDRPAFGLSERLMPGDWQGESPYSPQRQLELTLALMDELGLDQAVLIGNSAGGTLAAQLALSAPERVLGLVLVDAAVYRGGGAPAWTRPLLHTPQFDRLGPLLMRQFAGQAGQSFLEAAWSDPARLTDESRAAYRRALSAKNWDRALWELSKASREPDLAGRLAEVRQPALVLSGSDDRIVPPELSERLAGDLPEARLELLDGCGHVPQEECPDAFMDALQDWLAETGLLR